MLWLGGISVAFGMLALVKSASSGVWTLGWCTLGLLLLVFGADARRLWRIGDAVKAGAIVGGCMAVGCLMVGGRELLALLTVVSSIAAAAALAGFLQLLDRRLVARMIRAKLAGQSVEPFAVAAVGTARRVVFEVAFLLVEWERFDVLEQVARHSFVPGADSLRRFYLALALYSRGRLAEAMELAKTTDHRDQGPYVEDQWDQLIARIRISDGEAREVVASFTIASPVRQAVLDRKLILADAHAVAGDLERARTLVKEISSVRGPAFLERLRATPRPTASIATSLLGAPDSPYR
jgi:hypothetical protein